MASRFPSPPPIQASDRVPNAPILHLELEPDGPTTISRDNKFSVKVIIKVTYLAIAGSTSEQQHPITFHVFALQEPGLRQGFRLHRRRGQEWEGIEPESPCFGIADDPDVEVNVSQHRDFVSLRPGACWTTSDQVDARDDWVLPSDLADGDVLRYRFKGAEVDWWDWGGREDHAHTTVKLPCFVWSMVTGPSDNDGRPKLMVPESNEILFTYRP